MKGGKLPLGYTIVEVMIVLAVSGVMFVIAASFVNGRQARVSFEQGVNELASRIQGVISDVSDGHYSDVPFGCTQNGGTGKLIIDAGVVGDQGANPECVFLGKLFHFSPSPSTGAPGDPTKYEVLSLAGARQTTDGSIITDSFTTGSVPIDAHVTPIPRLTTPQITPQNLRVDGMNVIAANGFSFTGSNSSYAVGFIQGLGRDQGGGGAYDTGIQNVSLVFRTVIKQDTTSSDATTAIINGSVQYAGKVTICLTDGTRLAHLTIGGHTGVPGEAANKLAVDVKLGDTTRACI